MEMCGRHAQPRIAGLGIAAASPWVGRVVIASSAVWAGLQGSERYADLVCATSRWCFGSLSVALSVFSGLLELFPKGLLLLLFQRIVSGALGRCSLP